MGNSFTWIGGSPSLSSPASWTQPDPQHPVEPGTADSITVHGSGTVHGSVKANHATVVGTFTLDGSLLSVAQTNFGGGTLTIGLASDFGGGGLNLTGGTIDQTAGLVTAGPTYALNVINGGIYNLKGGVVSVSGGELIGDVLHGTIGTFTQTNGTNTTASMQIFSGAYHLSGGELNVGADSEYVGDHLGYTGTFTQSGGTNEIKSSLLVGYGATGTYSMSTGKLSAVAEYVGENAVGTLTQHGGDAVLTDRLVLGINVSHGANGTGTYTLEGTGGLKVGVIFDGSDTGSHGTFKFNPVATDRATLTIVGETGFPGLIVGGQGVGVFDMSRGELNSTLAVGYRAGSTGTMYLRDGELSSKSEVVGGAGAGDFFQTGGTNTVTGIAGLVVGQSAGRYGHYYLDKGDLKGGNEIIASAGEGTFTQNGGTNTIDATHMLEVSTSGGVGAYDLTLGTLSAGTEIVGSGGGNGAFYQEDGTNTVDTELIVGDKAGSHGNYGMTGGTVTVLKSTGIILGHAAGSEGNVQVDGARMITPNLDLGSSGAGATLTTRDDGVLKVTSTVHIGAHGLLEAQSGGIVEIGVATGIKGSAAIGTGGTLTGAGHVYANVHETSGGRVIATDGTLDVTGKVDGGGVLTIGNKGTLSLDKADSNDIRYTDGTGILALDQATLLTGHIQNLVVGDEIKLVGDDATAIHLGAGVLRVTVSGSSTPLTLHVSGAFSGNHFVLSSGANSIITLVKNAAPNVVHAAAPDADHFVFNPSYATDGAAVPLFSDAPADAAALAVTAMDGTDGFAFDLTHVPHFDAVPIDIV